MPVVPRRMLFDNRLIAMPTVLSFEKRECFRQLIAFGCEHA